MGGPTFDLGFTLPSRPLDQKPLVDAAQFHQYLSGQVHTNLTNQLQQSQQGIQDLQAFAHAHLLSQTFKHTDKQQALADKVQGHLAQQAEQLYAQAAQFGIPFPDPTTLNIASAQAVTTGPGQSAAVLPHPGQPATGTLPLAKSSSDLPHPGQQPGATSPQQQPGQQPSPVDFGTSPRCSNGLIWDETTQQCVALTEQLNPTFGVQPTGAKSSQSPMPALVGTPPTTTNQTVPPIQWNLWYSCSERIWIVIEDHDTAAAITATQQGFAVSNYFVIAVTQSEAEAQLETQAAEELATCQEGTSNYQVMLDCYNKSYQVVDLANENNIGDALDKGFDGPTQLLGNLTKEGAAQTAKQVATELFKQCPQSDSTYEPIPEIDCTKYLGMKMGSEEWFNNVDKVVLSFQAFGLYFIRTLFGGEPDSDCAKYIRDAKSQSLVNLITGGFCGESESTSQTDTSTGPYDPSLLGAIANPIGTSLNVITNSNDATLSNLASTQLGAAAQSVVCPAAKLLTGVISKVLQQIVPDIPLCDASASEVAGEIDVGKIFAGFRAKTCEILKVLNKCSDCNVIALLGLYGSRLVLNIFGTVKYDFIGGINAAVVATGKWGFSLGIKFKQLEELIDHLILYVCPPSLPSLGEAIELNKLGLITDSHYTHLVAWNGYPKEWADRFQIAKREKPKAHEQLEYYRRKPELSPDLDQLLRNLGYVKADERDMVKELYNKYPELQELLHWLQKNSFDTEYVESFSLLQNFSNEATNQEVIQDINALSNNAKGRPPFWDSFQKYFSVLGKDRTQVALEYISHWLSISKETGAEFMFRLRPEKYPENLSFTPERLKAILREQDYPPWALDRLIEISYKVLNQRYLQRMVEYGTLDRPNLIDRLKDLGFKPQDCELIADMLFRYVKLQRTNLVGGFSAHRIQQLYRDSQLDEAGARDKLLELSFSGPEIQQCLDVADLEFTESIRKQKIAAIRQSILKGLTDWNTASVTLQQLGYDIDKAKQYLELWQMERNADQHILNAHELIDSVSKGLLSYDSMAQRLLLMDFSVDAVAYYVALARLKVSGIILHNQQTQQKQQQALAAQIEKQITRQQKQRKEAAKITLDLDKAERKATAVLTKSQSKEQQRQLREQLGTAKSTAKNSVTDSVDDQLIALKAKLQDTLAKAKAKLNAAEAARKAQYWAEVATVKDPEAKAKLHGAEVEDIARLQAENEQRKVSTIKGFEQASDDLKDAGNDMSIHAQLEAVAPIEQQIADLLNQLAKDAADAIRTDAAESAEVARMP